MRKVKSLQIMDCDEHHKAALESMRFPNSYALMKHLEDELVDHLIAKIGLTKDKLQVTNGTVSGLAFRLLLDLNISIHDSPIPYSLNIANEFNIATHGMLGLAIASAKNLEEALGLATKFTPLINPAINTEMRESNANSLCIMTCNSAFGNSGNVLLEVSMMVLNQFLLQTQNNVRAEFLQFSHKNEYSSHYYEEYFQCPVRFNCEETYMAISTKNLESPMLFHDESTASVMQTHLENEMNKYKQTMDPWATEVRKYISLHLSDANLTSKVAVSDHLNITPRTLTRKLSQENTNYQLLLEEQKLSAAKHFLKSTKQSISHIAYEVGFNDPQTFSRAFKRWTGVSAREYREISD